MSKNRKYYIYGIGLLCFFAISNTIAYTSTPTSVNCEKSKTNFNLVVADSNDDIDYLIITTAEYKNALLSLAEWKAQKGLATEIKTMTEISSGYLGRDSAEQVKNCIKDYYENHSLQWVLLAGDVDDVPTRHVIALENYENDGNLTLSDAYYTDLTNTWNENDNIYWGEDIGDAFDYDAEVYVGRLPANNFAEMSQLSQNIINYEQSPPAGDWMTNTLYAGAFLTFNTDWELK